MGLLHDLRNTSRLGLLVAVAAATVGVIYGYDSSNIAGALLFMTEDFGLSTGQQQLVTTAVVVGEVLGAVFGGALANRIGRKNSMLAVAATFAGFSLLSALAWSVPSLMVARFLLGLTIGVSVVVVPVFVAESAAPEYGVRCSCSIRWPPSPASSPATWSRGLSRGRKAGVGCWAWPPSPER